MTIALPLSEETFDTELVADESGVLMVYEPSRVKMKAFYPLAAVLRIGWRIVRARHPRAGAARGARFGSRRVQ